jgi:hypothetical protein
MSPKFPDWMFAAIAIGLWELAELVVRKWHLAWARPVAYVLMGCCVLVVVVRYVIRIYRHFKHPHTPDPDEWKQY